MFVWSDLSLLSPLAVVGTQTGISQNTYPLQAEGELMNLTFPSQIAPLGNLLLLKLNSVFSPPKSLEGLIQLMLPETGHSMLMGQAP